MTPTTRRRGVIAAVITDHGTLPGPTCNCGYKYELGEWISLHKAQAIETALVLYAADIEPDDIPLGVRSILRLIASDDIPAKQEDK